MSVRGRLLLVALGTALAACREPEATAGAAPGASASALGAPANAPSSSLAEGPGPPPWATRAKAPAAPRGMVWIPPGALVAGTPPSVLPRIADEEMAGEQVVMKGFFISIYPYPNEEAAIPIASVTQEEAAALCAEHGKRLCTELEWERACKGPNNSLYEYGDRYRAEVCGTGEEPRMLPSGLRVACRSEFGVHDLHGGLWEWTSSPWGRGEKGNLYTVRGGNARAGEVVGRCANAMGRPRSDRSPLVGFRCCSGPRNEAEASVAVDRKPPLQRREPVDRTVATSVERAVKENPPEALKNSPRFRGVILWYWHPIGNEELVVLGGCAGAGPKRACGAAIARMGLEGTKLLAWAESGRYVPSVYVDRDPRDLWVYGGDGRGHYRRFVGYMWGRATVGEVQRNVKAPVARRKR